MIIWQVHLRGQISNDIVLDGVERLSQINKPSALYCHLGNTNDDLRELATAIPPFAQLLWFLIVCGLSRTT